MNPADRAALVPVDVMRQALAAATSIDEVKQIRDRAAALQVYMRNQKESLAAQNRYAEVKLRAERRAGEILGESDLNPGQLWRGNVAPVSDVPTLAEMGISKKQSMRWQMEASVPEELFERHVADTLQRGEELTSVDVLAIAYAIRRGEVVPGQAPETPPPLPSTHAYRCIVIDPPWPTKIAIQRSVLGRKNLSYQTMSIDEIGRLPIGEQADPKGCHIYLWSVHKHIPDALQLLTHWGFRYQCFMTWRKNGGFTPFSWQYSTEHVLFGTMGGLRLTKLGLRLDFEGKRREHSRKPEEFYDIVRQASPGPRLELFARTRRSGFDVWGNEIDRFREREDG